MCELQNDDELFAPNLYGAKRRSVQPHRSVSWPVSQRNLVMLGTFPRLACGANAVNQSLTSCKLSEVFITS